MLEYIDNSTLIDVRSPGEFSVMHVPNAINIPIDQLPFRLDEIAELKKPIITYCQSGNRSSIAVYMLKQVGIEDVLNGGGIQDLFQIINLKKEENDTTY